MSQKCQNLLPLKSIASEGIEIRKEKSRKKNIFLSLDVAELSSLNTFKNYPKTKTFSRRNIMSSFMWSYSVSTSLSLKILIIYFLLPKPNTDPENFSGLHHRDFEKKLNEDLGCVNENSLKFLKMPINESLNYLQTLFADISQ